MSNTLTNEDAISIIRALAADQDLSIELINGLDLLEARQLVARLAALIPIARKVKTELTLEEWCDTIQRNILNT